LDLLKKVVFYGFHLGKSTLNHHLGEYFWHCGHANPRSMFQHWVKTPPITNRGVFHWAGMVDLDSGPAVTTSVQNIGLGDSSRDLFEMIK